LLTGSQVDSLVFCGVQIGWESVGELLLQNSEVRWRAVRSSLVPESDKAFIKGSEKSDEVEEAMKVMGLSIGWIIVFCGQGDRGLQR
jgi:hypothetical protein